MLLLAGLAIFAACGFLAGRYLAPTETLYLIGTPVDLQSAASYEPARETVAPDASQPQTMCGAPTKSGKPCRRKVRGGGYCWQHRDKRPEATGQQSER
ncbi:MAG TPA: hypothetical protein VNO14_05000 [Blastocatellia bacterium]|nr:hypothetical protein [Blastocatellia bacterium]